MHCEQIEALLAKLVFDELDDPTKAALLAHLSGCQACRDQYVDLRAAAALLKEGIEAGPAPVLTAERKATLLGKASAQAPTPLPAKARTAPRAKKRTLRHAARPGFSWARYRVAIFSTAAALLIGVTGLMISGLIYTEKLCVVDSGEVHVEVATRSTAEFAPASADGPAQGEHDLAIPDLRRGAPYTRLADGPAPAAAPPASDRVRARFSAESGVDKADQDRGTLKRSDGYAQGPGATTAPARPPAAPAKPAESFGWKSAPRDSAATIDERDRILSMQSKDGVWKGGFGYGDTNSRGEKRENSAGNLVLKTPAATGRTESNGEEPTVFYQRAKESDHNESGEGLTVKGDSKNYLSSIRGEGEGGGTRGRQAGQVAGVYDSIGVGGGGGGGGRYGGRTAYGNKLQESAKTPAPADAAPPPTDPGTLARSAGDGRLERFRGGRPEVGATREGRPEAGATAGKPATVDSKLGAAKAENKPAEPQPKSRTSPGPAAARGERKENYWAKEESSREADDRIRDAYIMKLEQNEALLKRRLESLDTEKKDVAGMIVDKKSIILPGQDKSLAQHERFERALDQLRADTKNEDRAKAPSSGKKENRELYEVQDLARAVPDFPYEGKDRAAEPPPFVRLKPEKPGRATFALDELQAPGIGDRTEEEEGRKVLQEARQDLQQKVQQQQAEPDESLPSASFFKAMPVNPWVLTQRDRFSTFALAVDTASYTLARRFFRKGFLPPAASVRMEEFVNAFDYNYPGQTGDVFAIHAEGAPSPFRPNLTLLKVGVKGKVLGREGRKPAHLVFVIDGSGSMARPDRLPLIQFALRGLAGQLGPADRVSVVVFGAEARLAAEAVPAARRGEVLAAIDAVQPAGPTNLLLGLQLGYAVAQRQFRAGEINRVILCTDGVANIGASDGDEMLANIKSYRDQGVTFTAAGFGTGNYNDALLARLAAQGDGRYVFIDSAAEARRVFVEELAATLQSIAVDAKIQVEFDPARVRRYRLIGYEARAIRDEDFRNDAIEAAEVGSGQSATALYEVELVDEEGMNRQGAKIAKDDSRVPSGCIPGDALGTVFVRYRNADTGKIEEISRRVEAGSVRRRTVEDSPRFFLAAAVAEFAELLRESEYAQGGDFAKAAAVLDSVSRLLPLDGKVREVAEMAARAKGLSRAQ